MHNRFVPIPGFEAYLINNEGKIFSLNRKKFKIASKMYDGYMRVLLWKNNVGHRRLVHRLVLETFVGPCPDGMECCHNNGVRKDNRLCNLRWDTRSNNQLDAVKHGTCSGLRCGENSPGSKLTDLEVIKIRKEYIPRKTTQKTLAEKYNVDRVTICNVLKRKTWTHV